MSNFLSSSAQKRRQRDPSLNDPSYRLHTGGRRRKMKYVKNPNASTDRVLEEEIEFSRSINNTSGDITKQNDIDGHEKILVTKKTLDTMKYEVGLLNYPTTLYHIGEALSNSPSVLFDHCHPIEEGTDVHKQGDSSQNLNSILRNLLGESKSMKQGWNTGYDGKQLKLKLHELVKQEGSLDIEIQNWNEAIERLSTVLILPVSSQNDGEEEEGDDNLKENGVPYLRPSPKLKSVHSRKPKPFKASHSSLKYGLVPRKTKKKGSSVMDYYNKIVKTIGRTKQPVVWNVSSAWLQAKHSSSLPELRHMDNEKRQREGEKEEEQTDSLLNLRDQLFSVKIGDAERKVRSMQMKERERIEKDILRREQEEEDARSKASSLLRPLTREEEEIVQKAVYGIGPPDEILVRCNADSVQRRSMHCLQPGKWLNDEVIHYFYLMLANRDAEFSANNANHKRSHFFKSFFLTKLFDEGGTNQYKYSNVKRWSKKVPGKDIFALDKIFCPCNLSNVHWACAIIYVQEKRIQFFDSMTGDGMYHMKGLLKYLEDEWEAKKGGKLPDADKWKLIPCTSDTPVQENGFDCGVFTCMFADFISVNKSLAFSQEHITQCRKRIALSIMKGTALD